MDTGYRRKITSILVNTPPLHARNNERLRARARDSRRFVSPQRFSSFSARPEDRRDFSLRDERGKFRVVVVTPTAIIVAAVFNSSVQICSRVERHRVLALSRKCIKRTAKRCSKTPAIIIVFFSLFFLPLLFRSFFPVLNGGSRIVEKKRSTRGLLIKQFLTSILSAGKNSASSARSSRRLLPGPGLFSIFPAFSTLTGHNAQSLAEIYPRQLTRTRPCTLLQMSLLFTQWRQLRRDRESKTLHIPGAA